MGCWGWRLADSAHRGPAGVSPGRERLVRAGGRGAEGRQQGLEPGGLASLGGPSVLFSGTGSRQVEGGRSRGMICIGRALRLSVVREAGASSGGTQEAAYGAESDSSSGLGEGAWSALS